MYSSSVLATVLATLLTTAPLTSAASCNVAFNFRASRAKRLVPGSTFVLNGQVKNTGSSSLKDFYLQLQLPNFLVPTTATANIRYFSKEKDPSLQGGFVTFSKLTLPARKKLRVKVKVGVPTCQPKGSVKVNALVYQLGSNNAITCSSAASPYTLTIVAKKAWKKDKYTGGKCITPTPAPTTPGASSTVVATNTGCVEAKRLQDLRRELTQEEVVTQQRELITYTPETCNTACVAKLGVPVCFSLVDISGGCWCTATCQQYFNPFFSTLSVSNPNAGTKAPSIGTRLL